MRLLCSLSRPHIQRSMWQFGYQVITTITVSLILTLAFVETAWAPPKGRSTPIHEDLRDQRRHEDLRDQRRHEDPRQPGHLNDLPPAFDPQREPDTADIKVHLHENNEVPKDIGSILRDGEQPFSHDFRLSNPLNPDTVDNNASPEGGHLQEENKALRDIGYTLRDGEQRFSHDFGLSDPLKLVSAVALVRKASQNSSTLGPSACLYTVLPGSESWSTSRYVIINDRGKILGITDNPQELRRAIIGDTRWSGSAREVYVDISGFQDDKQSALLASLKFGDIGDPSTHFRLLTRPNLLKLVFDAKPRLEIPRNDAITVENRQAAIDIPGHTSDGSNFMLRFIANSVEHLEHFLAICRDIYKTALGTEDATYSMLEIVARARVEFAKHYPNVNIRAEVTAAASEIQVVEKGDSHADRGRPSMNAIVTMLNR